MCLGTQGRPGTLALQVPGLDLMDQLMTRSALLITLERGEIQGVVKSL